MKILLYVSVIIFLNSCFTGIESTKKIKLTRDDMREISPTAEDLILASVEASGNDEWQVGKIFVVTDDRASLVIDAKRIVSSRQSLQRGDTLYYRGGEMPVGPDGRRYPYMEFNRGEDIFGYASGNKGKSEDKIMSDELPGVVDCQMLDEVAKILIGKKVWTRSSLWIDTEGKRVTGLRFEAVVIDGIYPGDMVFPIAVRFRDSKGSHYYYMMNFGNSGKDSRSFATLFTLDDPQKKYPSISDAVWESIKKGEVKIGMTKEECRLAKGNPSDVNIGHSYSKDMLLWSYPDATVLYFEDGILTGINNIGK